MSKKATKQSKKTPAGKRPKGTIAIHRRMYPLEVEAVEKVANKLGKSLGKLVIEIIRREFNLPGAVPCDYPRP